ncbi:MAG: nitroreductase/quinone reductase family protein [Actinomycetota bacterium]
MRRKWRVVTTFQRYLLNPVSKLVAGYLPGLVLLETTGRRSGQRRRTPVGGHLEDSVLWVVSEHGRRAGYIHNIGANPKVRVRIGGHWRTGTASVLTDDDPRQRLRWSPNDVMIRLVGTDLQTVRIDLDPAASPATPS